MTNGISVFCISTAIVTSAIFAFLAYSWLVMAHQADERTAMLMQAERRQTEGKVRG